MGAFILCNNVVAELVQGDPGATTFDGAVNCVLMTATLVWIVVVIMKLIMKLCMLSIEEVKCFGIFNTDTDRPPEFSGDPGDWEQWLKRVKYWRCGADTCETKKGALLAQRIKGEECQAALETIDEEQLFKVSHSARLYIKHYKEPADGRPVHPMLGDDPKVNYGVDYLIEVLEPLMVKNQRAQEFKKWKAFWKFEVTTGDSRAVTMEKWG